MTTLTVYFALSPTSISSLSSTPTTIQPFQSISNRTKSKLTTLPSIALPSSSPSSISSFTTRRTSLKRNKTFFERFNPMSPSATSQQSDSKDSSTESQPRFRRRFTFRRSLRKSIQNKGGDNDDAIRSGFSFLPYYAKIFLFLYIINMINEFLS
jgi:hypothetical protein